MAYVPDNYSRFEIYDAEQAALEEKLPECDECGEEIYDDHFFNVDGCFICPDCMRRNHRVWIEDYLDEKE